MTSELTFLIPEIVLFVLTCIILLVDTIGSSEDKSFIYWLSQSTLIVTVVLLVFLCPDSTTHAMSMNFVSDPMGAILKIFICAYTSVVFFYSYDYLKEHELIRGEYFVLGLFAVLGMMVMVSAYSLLTIYLGLELLSLSLYAMVAMNRDSQSATEAAMKYFVLGALASGMLLYGISMLYGVSGAIDLASLSAYISQQTGNNILLIFGLVFVVVGIAFKLGAVPFHMWVPDVYQGAPTSVTLFIGSAPKIAAFGMAIRLLVDGMEGLVDSWQGMLIILAVLSMAAGNIIAISQTNIKRMLAYSTIAHIGFLLLGIISGSQSGYAGSMFYVLTYALMSMGAFGMVILLGRKGYEADTLDDFKGLAVRSPWFAFIMLILMFSMAGVPPLVGFWGKWFVIKEIIAMGHISLAAIAVLFSVIGAYYYLRIVKLMYFDKADQMTAIKAGQGMRFVLSINGLALLALGFMPGMLMALCLGAFA
ncbi:MAG: NADH-quinone oxidoreductase subunit NuoN [Gammaproteobacteria bacterium]|jgi:NADH-quinone oxidoreductase subunit N|nr:NADH-quinone oxidoreductase subunit NuoN [Gammaproteobacteria bacterium]